jgi:type I restriction enzyme R subunit
MPTPGEHKTVQARILAYAEAIGWTLVSREEAERRRGFDPEVPTADRARNRSLFFDHLLDAKVREFNPRYAEAEGALLGQFRHLHTDIYGNRCHRADQNQPLLGTSKPATLRRVDS